MAQKIIKLFEELKVFTELNFHFGYNEAHNRALLYDVSIQFEKRHFNELKEILNKYKAGMTNGTALISGYVRDEPISELRNEEQTSDYDDDLLSFILGEYEPKYNIELVNFVKSRKFNFKRKMEYSLRIYELSGAMIDSCKGLLNRKMIINKILEYDETYFYFGIELYCLNPEKEDEIELIKEIEKYRV